MIRPQQNIDISNITRQDTLDDFKYDELVPIFGPPNAGDGWHLDTHEGVVTISSSGLNPVVEVSTWDILSATPAAAAEVKTYALNHQVGAE